MIETTTDFSGSTPREAMVCSATISDSDSIPDADGMIAELLNDNAKVIQSLTNAYKEAESAGHIGLSNFLQERLDRHAKHGWMLTAMSKGEK